MFRKIKTFKENYEGLGWRGGENDSLIQHLTNVYLVLTIYQALFQDNSWEKNQGKIMLQIRGGEIFLKRECYNKIRIEKYHKWKHLGGHW